MELQQGIHLAYCTNIHPGETWPETFANLQTYALQVRQMVARDKRFAIGLRLSDAASRELVEPQTLNGFRSWLDKNDCYVFTINGFPFGQFHTTRVKEQVYRPDWTSSKRLEYTNRLFEILAALLPEGVEGSVSTLPGSFKPFRLGHGDTTQIQTNLWSCLDYISQLSEKSGRDLHLGLEPEPFGLFENTKETMQFFNELREARRGDNRLDHFIGVNYDTCHFAVQFEEANEALTTLRQNNIRISKLHLSSALHIEADPEVKERLQAFDDEVYLHQVIARDDMGNLRRYVDLPDALADDEAPSEWRIHFHVPLYMPAEASFATTAQHAEAAIEFVAKHPAVCTHLEMETYTWSVLPAELRSASVVDQLTREYEWTLERLRQRNLA